MKTFLFVLLLFVCNFILAQKEEKIKIGKPINSGFVFIDGKYIDAPYNFKVNNNNIYLNNYHIWPNINTKNKNVRAKKAPKLPPDSINTISKLCKYKNPVTENNYLSELYFYYFDKYKDEIANQKFLEQLNSIVFLDTVISFHCIYTFKAKNGQEQIIRFDNTHALVRTYNAEESKENIKEKINFQINYYCTLLKKGGCLRWNKYNTLMSIKDSIQTLKYFSKTLTILNDSLITVEDKIQKIRELGIDEYNSSMEENLLFYKNFNINGNFKERLEKYMHNKRIP